MMNSFRPDRREFLKHAGGLALAGFASASVLRAGETSLPNPVGCAAIAWSKNQLDHALQTMSQLGYQGVQLLGGVRSDYTDEKLGALREELASLHLKPVALSCSGLKLDLAQPAQFQDGVKNYATFFNQLPGKYLQVQAVGEPDVHYTAEQISALGRVLNDLGRTVQDAGLTMGFHPHVGTLGESREGLGQVLDSTDPRYVKLIADVAHLKLGGSEPAEVIRTYGKRLLYCHFKDVRKEILDAFKKDPAPVRHARNRFCQIGEGEVNFPAVVRALHEADFQGWVIVEMDSYVHPAGGPDESARLNKLALQKLGFQI